MITPLRRVGAGGDQENVMFLVLRWVTVKLCGGPVGAGEEQGENDVYIAQCSKVNRKVFLGDIKCPG